MKASAITPEKGEMHMAIEVEIHAFKEEKGGMNLGMKGGDRQLLAAAATINHTLCKKLGMDIFKYIIIMSQTLAAIDNIEIGAYAVEVDEEVIKKILKGDKDG